MRHHATDLRRFPFEHDLLRRTATQDSADRNESIVCGCDVDPITQLDAMRMSVR